MHLNPYFNVGLAPFFSPTNARKLPQSSK